MSYFNEAYPHSTYNDASVPDIDNIIEIARESNAWSALLISEIDIPQVIFEAIGEKDSPWAYCDYEFIKDPIIYLNNNCKKFTDKMWSIIYMMEMGNVKNRYSIREIENTMKTQGNWKEPKIKTYQSKEEYAIAIEKVEFDWLKELLDVCDNDPKYKKEDIPFKARPINFKEYYKNFTKSHSKDYECNWMRYNKTRKEWKNYGCEKFR